MLGRVAGSDSAPVGLVGARSGNADLTGDASRSEPSSVALLERHFSHGVLGTRGSCPRPAW